MSKQYLWCLSSFLRWLSGDASISQSFVCPNERSFSWTSDNENVFETKKSFSLGDRTSEQLTLIKTPHERMQSSADHIDSTWLIATSLRVCSEIKQLLQYLKCHTRSRSIIKCEMFYSRRQWQQRVWKMKANDSRHSAATEEKFFMTCVRNFWAIFSSSMFSKRERIQSRVQKCAKNNHERCSSNFNCPTKRSLKGIFPGTHQSRVFF